MTKAKTESKALATAQTNEIAQLVQMVPEGFVIDDLGQVTQWLDMSDDATYTDDDGNVKPIVVIGQLLGCNTIDDEDDDGNPITRYFYNIMVDLPCPITYKDENKLEIKRVAQPGEIVAVGGRAKLEKLKEWSMNGGTYRVFIKPNKKIKVGRGRSMWLFMVGHQTVKEPTAVLQRAPF